MYKKCPLCASPIVRKDGKYKTKQRYKCMACGHRFRADSKLSAEEVWDQYLEGKQTVAEIAHHKGVSWSTVKRLLATIKFEWQQPMLEGPGVVHLDATYFGRHTGVLLALESGTARLLYM